MNYKKIFIICIVTVFCIAAFTGLVGCNIINLLYKTNISVPSLPPVAAAESAATDLETTNSLVPEDESKLSEQSGGASFGGYFSELGLGKLPAGGIMPADLKKEENVFVSNGTDQLVIYGTLLKDAKLSSVIYDVKTKNNAREKTEFAMVMKKGGFTGSEPVNLYAGLFEYQIWIADKLVAVFPFEVRP